MQNARTVIDLLGLLLSHLKLSDACRDSVDSEDNMKQMEESLNHCVLFTKTFPLQTFCPLWLLQQRSPNSVMRAGEIDVTWMLLLFYKYKEGKGFNHDTTRSRTSSFAVVISGGEIQRWKPTLYVSMAGLAVNSLRQIKIPLKVEPKIQLSIQHHKIKKMQYNLTNDHTITIMYTCQPFSPSDCVDFVLCMWPLISFAIIINLQNFGMY